MNLSLVIMLSVTCHLQWGAALKRDKRYLLYSLHGSKLQLLFGTGLPIHLENMSATIGWVIKSAYLVPTNASIYTDPYVSFQRKRSIKERGAKRYELYRAFQTKFLSSHAAARDCLLKAICEAARVPFRGAGLLGRLLTIFFRPSTTEDQPETEEDRAYNLAESHGSHLEENCSSRYPACDLHLVDLLTVII